jgi:hypothetical protein
LAAFAAASSSAAAAAVPAGMFNKLQAQQICDDE